MTHILEIASRLGLEHNDLFLSFLKKEDVQALACAREIPSVRDPWMLQDPRSLVDGIHISWFERDIQKLPGKKKELFRSILSKILVPGKIPEDFRVFLLDHLLSLSDRRIRPDSKKIAESPLSFLNNKSSSLMELVFCCIGCHFLAETLRKVISKKQLDLVLSSLNPESRRYLRRLLFLPKKVSVDPFDIALIKNRPNELSEIVINKGRRVFEAILKQQSEEFQWYFLHQFDCVFADGLCSAQVGQDLGIDNIKKEASAGFEAEKIDTLAWIEVIKSIIAYLESSGAN